NIILFAALRSSGQSIGIIACDESSLHLHKRNSGEVIPLRSCPDLRSATDAAGPVDRAFDDKCDGSIGSAPAEVDTVRGRKVRRPSGESDVPFDGSGPARVRGGPFPYRSTPRTVRRSRSGSADLAGDR